MPNPTFEQSQVLNCDKKNMVVSASAGSGKTWVMIEFITRLVVEKRVPVRRLLVLTFTRAAAGEMRERLNKALLGQKPDKFILEQLDDLSICDVSTIDAFCEKIVKRNIDKLDLDESFRLIDDPTELKRRAFDSAINQFAGDELNEIYYSFRKNKDAIFEAILDLDDFFAVDSDAEKVDYFISNQEKLFEEALKELNNTLKKELQTLRAHFESLAHEVESEPKYVMFCHHLENALPQSVGENFIDNVHNLRLIDLPSVPVVRGEGRDEVQSEKVKAMRSKVKDFLSGFDKYNFDLSVLDKQKQGSLAVALLNLYKVFAAEYRKQKTQLDLLDFVDIEKLTLSLMQDENLLSSLQEQYDYIFVDEYQDTNRIQEAIIKPITAGGHFVAVGDPKQGIYGFRNATMEIMQEDISKFSSEGDSEALFLRGNFRSDDRLLSFVNRVFEKVMTEKSVGIDYQKTSMLKGEVPFEKMTLPSVRVDVVDGEEPEEAEKTLGVYSVREDELYIPDKNELEFKVIIARIDELLMSEIYDAKQKSMRRVEFDDIAVLFRSRSSLMTDLSKALGERGYPVLSDVKEISTSEGEVEVLVNFMKLLLNRDDDIALLSVLGSRIGDFSMDELATLRLENPDAKTFYEVYLNSTSPKLESFNKLLDDFKLSASVSGLYKSFVKLLTEKDYFGYLKQRGGDKLRQVYNFLHDLKPFDFDLPSAISYFAEIGGRKRGSSISGAGAIKLMTIHASKGLEYPIVILAGAGQKLESPNRKSYALNSKFGIGTFAFDTRQNLRSISPQLEIIRRQNHRKEMIDEIMIFYVALTRAKNHLCIIGREKINNLFSSENFDPLEAKNYLSLIFYAFGRNLTERLVADEKVELGDYEFNLVSEVAELAMAKKNDIPKLSDKEKSALEEYFNFTYDRAEDCLFTVKNSVTGLNTSHEEKFHEKIVIEERQDFITLGNAYHEAMKLLDFSLITNLLTLETELEKNKALFTDGYYEILDKRILLENILIIKNIVGESKLYKEKQFVMSAKLSEIIGSKSEENVLVQGVVDLFSIGEKNILIDFKFTQEKNPEKILKKYSTQLDLYAKAIEEAFNIKLKKKYILSLKNAQLIEYLG